MADLEDGSVAFDGTSEGRRSFWDEDGSSGIGCERTCGNCDVMSIGAGRDGEDDVLRLSGTDISSCDTRIE